VIFKQQDYFFKNIKVNEKAHMEVSMVRERKIVAIPNVSTPNAPVSVDADKCTGCNHCVEVCQVDVYIPHPQKGKSPIILHPEECWYCGCCVNDCPNGAMTFNWAIQHKPYWKNKTTGEVHQI
jgi:NAD-dependent dihydropyrimidine dehydrogenase PreA subunit